MSLIRRALRVLLSPFGSREVMDAEFGRLWRARRARGLRPAQWEGEWTHRPSGQLISVLLTGSDAGPDEASRTLLRQLNDRSTFATVRQSADPLLAQSLERQGRRQRAERLVPSGITIDDVDGHVAYWKLDFELPGDPPDFVTLRMRDLTAVLVEGAG